MFVDGVTWSCPTPAEHASLRRLPHELAELLTQRNGFILRGGALHVRGAVSAPLWHSLERHWTGELAMSALYPSVPTTHVPFAQDCVGDQFLLHQGQVSRLDGETGELEPLNVDLAGFIDQAVDFPDELLRATPLEELLRQAGQLHPGQLIHVYPPLCIAAKVAPSLRAVASDQVLRVHARLAAELRNTPDGTPVRISPPSLGDTT
jgi:hypothetical protein